MVANERFLSCAGEIADEGPKYRLGGYGRDGTCDCIGLTIGAIRRAGGAWTGTHGSNYAARYEIADLHRVSADELYPGMQLLKARDKGDSRWKLPSRYAGHADQRDYYHAGVVCSVSPLCIVHSTGTGLPSSIKRDSKLGAWLYGGRLKKVDYGASGVAVDAAVTVEVVGAADAPVGADVPVAAVEIAAAVTVATVWTQNGGKLKLRAKPTKACRLWWEIPYGAEVEVLETDTGSAGWWKVRYGKKVGYCWQLYLAVG